MIKIDLYDTIVKIKICKNRTDLRKLYNKFNSKFKINEPATEDFQACVVVNPDNLTECYLLLNQEDMTISTITHENLHLTNRILRANGIYPDPLEDETYAILNGHLNEKVFKYLYRKGYKIIN